MLNNAIILFTTAIDTINASIPILYQFWSAVSYPIMIVVSTIIVLLLVALNWYLTWTLVLRHVGPFKDFLKARAKRLAAEKEAAEKKDREQAAEVRRRPPRKQRVRIGLFGPYIPQRKSDSTARQRPIFLPPPISIAY
ncbi:hypothetical protein FOL47_005975 [Perkinsus chesapeaki]|uniref:Uncharacterized protein n=1 Tax=Perkinsus chesapeaki TaxID=330153 RepID=A0A7J6LUJ2_PERCH|nr:hypothetical protein FOL47_005975 [Perkinsus chesapeaki]